MWAGFLFLAVVLDAWSRRIVGWAMAAHLRTELLLDALNMAIGQRRPTQVIHHPIKAVSTRLSPSGSGAATPASGRRWDPWATPTTAMIGSAARLGLTRHTIGLVPWR
jgi:transposase InsO family protein